MSQTCRFATFSLTAVSLVVSALLTGCGVESSQLAGSSAKALVLQGKVYGGQQPISGAQVYLYASTDNGYASNAVSLLGSPGYVTTDVNGKFALAGDYSIANCPYANSIAYVVALGGNAGAGVNPNIALMAPLGNCSNLGSGMTVNVNEVSTVVSVYALHQFLNGQARQLATSSTNTAGLINAMLQVFGLMNLSTGATYTQVSNGDTNGVVPQQAINTLANLLATCVNDSTQCSTIFRSATPTQSAPPTDTLGLALTLANNPTYNVANTFSLITPTTPFNPALSTAPTDWGLEAVYSGGALAKISSARFLDIDSSGNVYIANAPSTGGFISEFNNLGLEVAQGTVSSMPLQGIAIAPNGNIFAGSNNSTTGQGNILAYGSSITRTPTITPLNVCDPWQIASDSNGYILAGNAQAAASTPGVCSFNPSTATNTFIGVGYPSETLGISVGAHNQVWGAMDGSQGTGGLFDLVDTAGALALDTGSNSRGFVVNGQGGTFDSVAAGNGYSWVVGGAGNGVLYAVKEAANTGSVLSSIQINLGSATTSLASRDAIVDGNSNLWFTLSNGMLYEVNSSGTSSFALQNSSVTNLWGLGIDNGGNVWASVPGTTGSLIEYIGMAAPVQTPRSANIVP